MRYVSLFVLVNIFYCVFSQIQYPSLQLQVNAHPKALIAMLYIIVQDIQVLILILIVTVSHCLDTAVLCVRF